MQYTPPASSGTGAVDSVNGHTGVVVLAAADVNAAASNDARLTDSRTPTAHKGSHATGQSDALAASDIGAAASNHNHDGSYIASMSANVDDTTARLALTGKPKGFRAYQADDHSIYEVVDAAKLDSEAGWAKVANDVLPFAATMTGNPSHSGTEEVGSTLTAASGTASGRPTPAHSEWKWQRSDNGTSGWVDIEGATSSTYVLVVADSGKYVRPAEKFSNAVGSSDWAPGASSGAIVGEVDVYVTQVAIVSGGTGYVENEVVSGTTGTLATEGGRHWSGHVTAVDENGAITGFNLDDTGFYQSTGKPLNQEETSSSGSGVGATFDLTWNA